MSQFLRSPGAAKYLSFLNGTLNMRLQHTQTKMKASSPAGTLNIGVSGPVFRNAKYFPEKVAIRDRIAGYTYANIFLSANELSKEISSLLDHKTNERVLFLCPNDVHYVITLWAIWMAGQIAIPVSPLHPSSLLLYYANDSSSKLLITVPEYSEVLARVARNAGSTLHVLDDKLKLNCTMMQANEQGDLDQGGKDDTFYDRASAMVLYTSGTTGNPKGVVLSHRNISAQASSLLDAWKWSSDDVLLHSLPLHHIHGIVNALLCPLYAGAKTILLKKFNANTVWSYLLGVGAKPEDRRISMFMGVPTMYMKLVHEYERVFQKDPKMADYIRNTLRAKLRLMVSGSSPLPEPLHKRWEEITGHKLLERYGMTETGMLLSNSYESDREPGYVGMPLPGVSVKMVEVLDDDKEQSDKIGRTLLECSNVDGSITFKKLPQHDEKGNDPVGELLVKGCNVFEKYYERPETTNKAFTNDGWFKTDDLCQYSMQTKKFKILGRKSTDIIKSGGYKISSIEVESVLLGSPLVKDCAVVGVEDKQWGNKIVAVIQRKEQQTPQDNEKKAAELTNEQVQQELEKLALEKLPKYSVPKEYRFIEAIPKNYMGKTNKKEVVTLAFSDLK